MKIDPNAPAYPTDQDYHSGVLLNKLYPGANILTVIASQQLAALVGSVHEDQAITEQYSQDLAKEAVMLSKALINELNSTQEEKPWTTENAF
jgi:hypothetical protein